MTPDPPLVLVAGAASRDVVGDDARGWRLGGAAAYGALTLARLGIRVRAAIGVDEAAAGARELDVLHDAGVELLLVPLASGPVFENLEAPGGRRQRCLAPSDPVRLAALPSAWTRGLDGLLLAPVAGELDAAWARIGARLVALGWQGLLRELRAGETVVRRAPAPSALLTAASIVVASGDDVAPGTRLTSLAAFLEPGTTLVLTEAGHGGRTLRTDAQRRPGTARRYRAIPSDRIVDPTGAGDVFVAAWLAARLHRSLGSAPLLAAAASSLAIEAPGLAGVPDLAAVRARMTRAPRRTSRRPSDASSLARGRPSQA